MSYEILRYLFERDGRQAPSEEELAQFIHACCRERLRNMFHADEEKEG